ncbi:hypothetical protein ACQZ5N_03435 [Agrobacterium sp. 22-221-1]
MPISAERMKRYPGGSIYSKEWKAFRASLLERAVNCCEGTPRAVSNLRNSTSRITPSPAQEANTMQSEESNTLVKLAKAVIEHAPEGADAFWDIKFSDIEAALSAAGPVALVIEYAARIAERYDETDTLTAPKAIATDIRALSTLAATTEAYCSEGTEDDTLKECFLHHIRTTIGFLAFGMRTGPEMTMYEEGFKAGYRRCQSDNEPELGEDDDELNERTRNVVAKLRESLRNGSVDPLAIDNAVDLLIDQSKEIACLSAEPQPSPSVAVKALEWRNEPIPPSGETLAPSVVGLYCIPHSGDRFYLRFRDAMTLGDYSTLDKAKAAAQADYKARIRSTLSAQALSATSVAVKTLQWDDDGGNLKARMGDREWMLNITADGKTWAGSTRPFVFDRNLTWSAVPNCSGVSLEAAKAACQADCLSRYAALSAQVQDVAEDIYIAADDVSGTSGAWVQQGSYTGDVDVHRFGALQEGWQLVPEDATDEMVSAALKVDWGNEDEEGVAHDIWHAMVAAAPAKQEG